jgi:hypothetical protein
LYKFELLSKKSEEIKKITNNEIKKMPIIQTKRRSMLNRVKRHTRSKSIGCEEDLKTLIKNKKLYFKQIKDYLNELRLKKNELNNSSNCVNELLKSPLFLHIHKNLIHFIDDDDDNEDYLLSPSTKQQNEKIKQKQFNLLHLNKQINGNKSGTNIEDYSYGNDEDEDQNEDENKLTTKSVPNSPRLFLRQNSNEDTKNEQISFVYDINLYTERNNLDVIDFDNQKENIELKNKEQTNSIVDYDDELSIKLLLNKTLSNSSTRSSSLSSLHKLVNKKLEPLEINEINKPSSSTSSSSNDSTTESISITPVIMIDSKATNSSDSLKDVDLIEKQEDKIILNNNEDLDGDSINSLSESQIYLKENYEKAKKERQLEEETAIQEKKRLQVCFYIKIKFKIK